MYMKKNLTLLIDFLTYTKVEHVFCLKDALALEKKLFLNHEWRLQFFDKNFNALLNDSLPLLYHLNVLHGKSKTLKVTHKHFLFVAKIEFRVH